MDDNTSRSTSGGTEDLNGEASTRTKPSLGDEGHTSMSSICIKPLIYLTWHPDIDAPRRCGGCPFLPAPLSLGCHCHASSSAPIARLKNNTNVVVRELYEEEPKRLCNPPYDDVSLSLPTLPQLWSDNGVQFEVAVHGLQTAAQCLSREPSSSEVRSERILA